MMPLGAWSEWILIAVVALIVLGPKEIPTVLHFLGRTTQKIKRLLDQGRGLLSDSFYEGQFDEYRRQMQAEVKKQQKGPVSPPSAPPASDSLDV
jgi:Sec-independent protein translocase protein TatA